MQQRFHKFILACLSFLLVGQSLAPVAALAEVSVRCKTASSAPVTPCLRTTLMATDAAGVAKQLACCKSMGGSPSRRVVVSVPGCLVSITLLDTKPAILGPQAHQWFLSSAPVLAPPAIRTALATSLALAVPRFSSASFDLLPCVAVRSHGLRGPPCA
jgi:hypothetical protein